jgi:DNA-3-methyladenine glycosylase
MSARRGVAPHRREISNGPGKLCHALGLDGRLYGSDLATGPLYLAEGSPADLGRSPRINIHYAGAWAEKPWRFFERGNNYVSVPPRI